MKLVAAVTLCTLLILFAVFWSKMRRAHERVSVVVSEAQPEQLKGSSGVAPPSAGGDIGAGGGVNSSLARVRNSTWKVDAYADLPPSNAPLSASAASLTALVKAGNFLASCRLAEEVETCIKIDITRGELTRIKQELRQAATVTEQANAASTLTLIQKRVDEEEVLCAGFDAKLFREPWVYRLAAALQGHVPSMVAFGSLPSWDPFDPLANLGAWAAWKRYSGEFLETAAAHGDRSAVFQLAEDYADESIFGPGGLLGIRRVDVDHERALLYTYAENALTAAHGIASPPKWVIERTQRLEAALGPELVAKSRTQADALIASWGSNILKPSRRNANPEPLSVYELPCNPEYLPK